MSIREERRQSQAMSFTGRESRASSLQKIAGPERRTYSSLFIFKESNPVRRLCRAISESKPFDYFILTTILVNCVLLALNQPLSKQDKSKLIKQLEEAEVYLLAIFIAEAVLKIITQGFILHPGAYLRSAWNILDFVVVVTGILSSPQFLQLNSVMKGGSLKAVRAGRVLRPLKLVSGIPSLQVVMKSIIRAMAPLLQICLLVSFVIVIYSIIGLEFLKGKFLNVCMVKGKNEIYGDEPQLCGESGFQCHADAECKSDHNVYPGPNYGITSFDNILLSMVTVFTCITCEGWTDTMYWTFDVMEVKGHFIWIYYVTLNIIGAQFMLNLVLGVLSGEFGKERERVENRTAFLVLRQGQQMDRALTGYMDWIDAAEQAIVNEEDEIEDERMRRAHMGNRDVDGNVGMTKVLTTNADGKSFRLNIGNKRKKSETWKEMFRRRNRRLRLKVKTIVNHEIFYWLVMACVLLNTIPLAVQHFKQPQWLTDLQDISELVFLTFFITEMCLKVYGLGATKYFNSKFNKFDSVVVTAGILEQIIYKLFKISMGISVLRALRLLRLFKFTKYWSSLKNLITSLLNSMHSIISLLFLLFLFILIFALLGMQLFGGMFASKVPPPRSNFDDFFNAMLAVFQILTGEDWNVVMYEGIRGSGGKDRGLPYCLYFIALVVLGNYTLLNVFLAIAVDNLTNAQEIDADLEEEDRQRQEHRKNIKEMYKPIESVPDQRLDIKDRPMNGNGEMVNREDLMSEGWLKTMKNPSNAVDSKEMLKVNTLFLFFPGNPIRIVMHKIVSSKYFDNIILSFILISSAFLALEDPTDKQAKINTVLRGFDFFFTSIFAMEVLVKIINYGVILHKGSYFRDGWNFIDALVVCCAIASLVLDSNDSGSKVSKQAVKILRVLRVLRPLKAINKTKKLKAVFQCMVYSLRNVINILMITIQFLIIFSVMGVQLFMGKFHYCTDESKIDEESCHGQYITFHDNNFHKPTTKKREWKNYEFNFDDLGQALVTLFTSSTGEGWPDVMFHAIDSTKVGQGPIVNSQLQVSFFFVFFVVIFSFFFLNIFVALIILTFQEQGEAEEGDCEIDRNQRGCLHIAMEAKPAERFMPENPNSIQYKIWVFVDSVPFEYFVMLLICGNTLILMLQYNKQPDSYEDFLNNVNDIFTFLFTIEFLLKVFALRQNYFRDGWNVFDFIIVLGSLLAFIFKRTGEDLQFDVSLFRLFRAARIIKLLRRGYTIRILLWTFLQSFKALPYVGMLIALLFFIYAIIGMQMFSLIEIDSDEEPMMQINRHNHFRNFVPAIQVLFRSATGENWQNIMLACGSRAKCDKTLPAAPENEEYCGSNFAFAYFISFIFFCSWLMLNLFVAVIMDNFGYLTQDESILGPHHLDEFIRVWAEFDPRATGRIKHTEVCQLLRQMSPPIGLGTKCPKVVAYKRLIRMNMPLHSDNTVDFTATLFALVRTALNIMTEKNNLHSNDMELRLMLKRVWPAITKKTLDRVIPKRPQGANQMTVGKIYCAKLIYENYKHVKASGRKKLLGNIDEGNNRPPKNNLPNGYAMRREPSVEDKMPLLKQRTTSTHHINEGLPNVHNGIMNLSTPNLTNLYQLQHSPHRMSQSAYSINNELFNEHQINTNKQQIALAIKSGQSPYEMYGIPDTVEDDDWC